MKILYRAFLFLVSTFFVTQSYAKFGNLTLGNQVWNDYDGDGNRDPGEPGIANVTVKLYTDNDNNNLPDGPVIAIIQTDLYGRFTFTGLAAGRYIASMPLLPGFSPSPSYSTPATSIDPDTDVDNDNNLINLVNGQMFTNAITLADGTEPTTDGDDNNSNLTLDLAECGNSFIGNFVWDDINRNGLQDAGEPGINGATVLITFEDGTTATTQTLTYLGNAGYYDFRNLGPGTYKITFSTPAGYAPTLSNIGTNDSIDSDPLFGEVTLLLGVGQSNFTIDAGFYQAFSGNLKLGNQVWNDYDGDGKKDSGEPGIGNVTVSIYTDNDLNNLPDGPAIGTTVTDLFGKYAFNNLVPGRYVTSIPLLVGYTQSPNTSTQATSPNPDNNVDNDNNIVNNINGVLFTKAITLAEGTEPTTDGDDANSNLTMDMAECGNSFIGDFVWNDINQNGIQDAGEPGINGATITITFEDGTTAFTQSLNYNGSDGYYDFKNLGPGTYKLTFSTPSGFTPTISNAGTDDAKDSDPINRDAIVTIAANQSDFTIDAGYYQIQSGNLRLGNQVWNDFDGDGKRDSNEPGIGNVTVSLYTDNDGDNLPDGAAVATTVTDLFGKYIFTGLSAGRYIASIPLLAGYSQSPNSSTQATSPNPDNDVDNDNNIVHLVNGVLYTNAITLTDGGEPTVDGDDANGNLTFDLAECGNSFIGDFVWNDINSNGLQDAGEPGINGADVTITFEDGTIATTQTLNFNGRDGYYDFKNLGPGTYKISFATPAGYAPTTANVGTNDSIDSDPINGDAFVTIAANQSDFSIDAGFVSGTGLRLGNLVWNDINLNGIKDTDEPGISNAIVSLYEDNNADNVPDGAAIATTTTVNGLYGFSNLLPGKYIVGVTIPAGYTPGANTGTSANPDNDVDSDNNGVNLSAGELKSNFITLATGAEPVTDGDDSNSNQTLDFALVGNAVIGDFVFNDLNANGIQDANEVGIANATVKLVFSDGTVRTTFTNAMGKYSFTNLGPDNYLVQFITPINNTPSPANQGTNDAKDSDPVNGEVAVTLTAGQVNNTIDAGFYKSKCIATTSSCGVGYLTVSTGLVTNGDFSTAIVSPTAGNTFTGDYTTPGIVYNFGTGTFTAQSQYEGDNLKPASERGFSIINTTGAFVSADSVNQLPFPGDVANGIPATNYFMFHNGNDLGGNAIVWEQTINGLVPGKNYRFRFYVSNMVEPSAGLANPVVELMENGNVVLSTVTIDEAGSANATALNGWKRIEYSFTATVSSTTFKIVNSSQGIYGNDLGLTAIGIEACEKDTDGDCVADLDDIDDDNDGILDVVENGGYDALQDCDNDGIANYKDQTPGCVTPAGNDIYGHPFQPLVWIDCNGDGINDFFDWDRDGIINELDLDSDNDGIIDIQESRDSRATDNNFDGMADGIDADGDGLMSSADRDDNNPSIAASIGLIPQDLDRDTHPNYLDMDSDGDGIVDHREALELDAYAAGYTGLTMGINDDDKDGVRTVNYTSNNNDADNFRGFGAKGIIVKDNDNDGFPNPYDIDSDNDGITDNVEGQPTCSEVQPFGIDDDGDGLDDAYDTDKNICFRRSPGITPFDKDDDGIPDYRDLDTDNDGAPDINEGSGIYGNFVTDYNDTDEDGLIDQFDIFNIKTAIDSLTHNVAHGNMGPNGNFDGPIPAGSNAQLPQQAPGTCPFADRDWRDVTILPLSLIEFKGSLTTAKIAKLNWKVANESNMSHYVVERSINGRDFAGIGQITARGNSNSTITYAYDDNVAGLGSVTVYYRLKEVEKSADFKVSHILAFKITDKASTNLSIYPNPAKNFFVLKINAVRDAKAAIRIMDMAGRNIVNQSNKIVNGSNALTIGIQHLTAGTYNVQVIIDGEVTNQKLIVTN